MTRYLLDTNIISDLVRNPQGVAGQNVERVGQQKICTSIIVAAEARYGAAKKASPRLTVQLESVLSRLEILPWEAPADAVYATIRSTLERTGKPIGSNDLLIAAHAVALGLILVTDNADEFARVDGLVYENWLR